jgi:hypothetical protein
MFETVTERNDHGRHHHHCRARTVMRKRSGKPLEMPIDVTAD